MTIYSAAIYLLDVASSESSCASHISSLCSDNRCDDFKYANNTRVLTKCPFITYASC